MLPSHLMLFTKSVIVSVAVSTSGQSNVDIRPHRRRRRFNRILQRGANVPSHPSAHWSPQSKRQMDRLSRFRTAYGRKCLYFTMGAPIHQNCPFPWGIWTSHVTRDAFGPCEPTTQTAPRSVQPSLHRSTRSVSIVYNGLPVSPSKLPLPILASGPHAIRGSLGPPDSGTQMVLDRSSRFLQGSLV